jgi:hypothetical protein
MFAEDGSNSRALSQKRLFDRSLADTAFDYQRRSSSTNDRCTSKPDQKVVRAAIHFRDMNRPKCLGWVKNGLLGNVRSWRTADTRGECCQRRRISSSLSTG